MHVDARELAAVIDRGEVEAEQRARGVYVLPAVVSRLGCRVG